MPKQYEGEMSREDGIAKLKRLAERLRIPAASIRVRPVGAVGMTLAVDYHGAIVTRQCESQEDRDRNFACLVLWLEGLVRNIEREIETLSEAFGAEGVAELPASIRDDAYGGIEHNPYSGNKSVDDSSALIRRSLERLRISENDVSVSWHAVPNEARIRIRLPSGRHMEKTSTRQDGARSNLAALALWLQSRALNWERGIEKDMDRLFAPYLLPEGARR